jgi:hypothetical protein
MKKKYALVWWSNRHNTPLYNATTQLPTKMQVIDPLSLLRHWFRSLASISLHLAVREALMRGLHLVVSF